MAVRSRGRSRLGFLVTDRVKAVLAVMARGPFTTPQAVRYAEAFLLDLMAARTGTRLFLRALERCVRAGWLVHRPFPGSRFHVWFLSPSGAAFLAGAGTVAEVQPHSVEDYIAWPHHSRLVKDVQLALVLGKHREDRGRGPRWLMRLGWEEHVVLDLRCGERIEPDALVYLVRTAGGSTHVCPLEVDRGTEVLHGRDGWTGKVQRYLAWSYDQPEPHAVLVVASSERRLQNLVGATNEVLGARPPRLLFTTASALTPETFAAPIWLAVPDMGRRMSLRDLCAPGGRA